MNEFDRAKQRTLKMRERGRMLTEEQLMSSVPKDSVERKDVVPVLLKPKMPSGKVKVEVRVWLADEPMTFQWMTEMRSHLVNSQLNRQWLGDKFREMFRIFGRLHDIS